MEDPACQKERRLGDAMAIDGAYQHRALIEGPPIQRFWHTAKLNLLDWLFPVAFADRILDVGTGSGVMSDAMASRGADVDGVDANPAAIRYASATFGRPGLRFHQGFLDELAFPPASFDKALCLEVIEHVYPNQVKKLLSDLWLLLKPGGCAYLTTPNYKGLWPIVEWTVDRFSSIAKMDSDQHVTRFNARLLKTFLTDAGFEVRVLRTYCTFAPFLAPISWALARKTELLERRVNLPFGNVLAAVARKPG
jgi:2-polyprenyl-3-methyl-5-hydroxy-6-metoxy-1,4-benzoquinol methylase